MFGLFLLFGLLSYGQDRPSSKDELLGCWYMEPNKKENGPFKRLYKSCDTSAMDYRLKYTRMTLFANGICEFKVTIQDALCPIQYQTIQGSWTYDTDSSILEIYYPKDFKKEFWDKVKVMHSDIEIPNPRLHKKFRILDLVKNQMVVELVNNVKNSAKVSDY